MQQKHVNGDVECALEGESARIFWIFTVWLYKDQLVCPPEGLGKDIEGVIEREWDVDEPRLQDIDSDDDEDDITMWVDEDLVCLYLFSRRWHVDELANLALSTLAMQNSWCGSTTGMFAVEAAFDGGHWTTLLCNFLVDEACWTWEGGAVTDDLRRNFPKAYLDRVEEARRDEANWERAFCLDPCRYHIHHGGEEQKRCSKRWREDRDPVADDSSVYHDYLQTGSAIVGAGKLRLVLHKGLIEKAADFFRGAFSGQFLEGQDREVELPREDPAVFLAMMYWLYNGKLRPVRPMFRRRLASLGHMAATESPNVSAKANSSHIVDCLTPIGEQIDLVSLDALADRRGICRLRNKIVDRFIEGREDGWPLPDAQVLQHAYDELPSSSRLCGFLEHEASWFWDRQKVENMHDYADLPHDFLASLVKNMVYVMRTRCTPTWRTNFCRYHEHKDDEEEAVCKEAAKDWQERLLAKGVTGTCRANLKRSREHREG